MISTSSLAMCCGADQVYNWSFPDDAATLVAVEKRLNGSYQNRFQIAILAQHQLTEKKLNLLKRTGFKFLNRFYNSVHGNENGGAGSLCFVFYRSRNDGKAFPEPVDMPPPEWENASDESPFREFDEGIPNPFGLMGTKK